MRRLKSERIPVGNDNVHFEVFMDVSNKQKQAEVWEGRVNCDGKYARIRYRVGRATAEESAVVFAAIIQTFQEK